MKFHVHENKLSKATNKNEAIKDQHHYYQHQQQINQTISILPSQHTSSSEFDETKLFQAILSDNKKITHELRIQLETIQQLQNENEALKTKLEKVYKESELCLDRDELHTKRNVVLIRENKLLKEKMNVLAKQVEESMNKYRMEEERMINSHEEEKRQLLWQNEKLRMDALKIRTQFEQQRKECKWLNSENIRLEKLLSAATK